MLMILMGGLENPHGGGEKPVGLRQFADAEVAEVDGGAFGFEAEEAGGRGAVVAAGDFGAMICPGSSLRCDPIEESDRVPESAQAARLGEMRTRFNELKSAAQ